MKLTNLTIELIFLIKIKFIKFHVEALFIETKRFVNVYFFNWSVLVTYSKIL